MAVVHTDSDVHGTKQENSASKPAMHEREDCLSADLDKVNVVLVACSSLDDQGADNGKTDDFVEAEMGGAQEHVEAIAESEDRCAGLDHPVIFESANERGADGDAACKVQSHEGESHDSTVNSNPSEESLRLLWFWFG